MKLLSFSVKNYRSITDTEKIRLSSLTIFVGPNNEGKSNILNALMLGFQILSKKRLNERLSYSERRRNPGLRSYNWERDYPLNLQSRNRPSFTDFIFEIQLSEEEIVEFKDNIKSNLNGTLPIKISIDKEGTPTFKIMKRGRGSKILNKKSDNIVDFISSKIDFFYIPAIRSTNATIDQINEMIRVNLHELNSNVEYKECIEKIMQLQQPIYDKIALDITKSLQSFLPQVTTVEVNAKSRFSNYMFSRDADIKIDDGTLTDLHYKGDGIQSLVAISLVNYLANTNSGKNIVLSIEEPEAHLHPMAIHQLKNVLKRVSETQQVIISTHSPLLIDTGNIKNNIIVNNNKAKVAKNIREVRTILGVRAPDNLVSAELVLLVEGLSDYKIMKKILEHNSKSLKNALSDNKLVIVNMGGATNLVYQANLYKNIHLTKIFVFLDNDSAAKTSITKVVNENIVEENEYMLAIQRGLNESELEDLFDMNSYSDAILNKFGVNICCDDFTKNKNKWSNRMENCFINNGKQFDEQKIKELVADAIVKNIEISIPQRNKEFFDSLIKQVEARF